MKIGIITLPSVCNYGGVLQAYALQQTLKKMGHESVIIRRERPVNDTRINIKIRVKNVIKRILGKPIYTPPSEKQKKIIESQCRDFIKKYMTITEEVAYSTDELKNIVSKYNFETIIVGSDQVWRPRMTADIKNFYLDFCNNDVKKIAYAASFGVDYWEYDKNLTEECSKLAKDFKLITVREDSGIRLCKDYLSVESKHVLDPTMLLDAHDYISLTKEEKESSGKLFCYILDDNNAKKRFIKEVAHQTNLKPFSIMPTFDSTIDNNANKHLNECIFQSPNVWLKAFIDAEMVITDSFHGTVFSIIFNKPFWVIGNNLRGNARFSSLLKTYKLEHRFIDNICATNLDFSKQINWDCINNIRKEKKEYSLSELYNAI